ncbi:MULTISPECIES: type ISP restriction/modification enzyme [unclassified Rhizobium]|uniref:type ISP restriction/modification enzyme n=1 Tax=unclassified Rhizobium TaxID=2613769 RepID=UPI00161CA979|nr:MULTISPECIES: type ISP restriction/modification enzyme [unclassified Rhizobium]MBB3290641.1 putative helicase [Rhizobium sp. BK252]MBB3405421.1 putative helicase [Rhizobium sp. BK289]MBB3418076.1 putative helicase [Rhizobium sp. BK284]MBB3485847.1 putative helicase [Rhizobium sp. BK347]
MKALADYVRDVARKYEKGNATEHTYRESLVKLSDELLEDVFDLTNEPKRQACGAPDYILQKKDVPVGYIEAKDIGVSLDKAEESEQMARYLHSLDNLILTDYLEFRFYRSGEKIATIQIAKVTKGKVIAIPDNFERLVSYYEAFADYKTQTIKSAKVLAGMMAKKAVLVKDVFSNILASEKDSSLHDQYEAFKQVLLHQVTSEEFSDIYAETLAYGLFTARLHDHTPETFSREEAYKLIPRSNPFLRELFTYVGTKLDERAEWIVDELCDVFRATDVKAMLPTFNRGTGRSDPFLHFYETFLGAYNPEKKEARGVWYTPESVVQFIVRAVDDVLIDEFHLAQGLSDTSTVTIKVDAQNATLKGKATKKTTVKVDKEVHKVQLLDVATGTGTFLAEAVVKIYERFKKQQGMWSSYVEQHLIPRLHGFELLMASYAMCHMKLEILLEETGYKPKGSTPPRLNVYLTNSLQKADEEVDKLPLIEWFSRESNEASYIKKNTPIMVAMGNPPYRGISSNKGELIVSIEDYKYVNGVHFGEKKHWLNDDYVKFIRLGEYFVEKNGEGILGYITNHGYIDNPTFRGMRWHLLRTFSHIYILDLHGNSNKLEKNPSGGVDINVFDIQQGVSIIVAFKRAGKSKELAKVSHAELWGSRESKYKFLAEKRLKDIRWTPITPKEPFYYFVPRSTLGEEDWKKGFRLDELFKASGAGIVTARDEFVIDIDDSDLLKRLTRASKMKVEEAREEFDLRKDVESWRVEWALEDLKNTGPSKSYIKPILYRPFDVRSIYYTDKSGGVLARPNGRTMIQMIGRDNIALIAPKQSHGSFGVFVTTELTAHKAFDAYNINTLFPLYTIEKKGLLQTHEPNFDPKVWARIRKAGGKGAQEPERVFDYIYGVLHATSYQDAYREFLKSSFPRVPYPSSPEFFDRMAELGHELRLCHQLKHASCKPAGDMASYPVDGDDKVRQVRYKDGKVWINATQFFDAIPSAVWELKIGGYKPADKWLKDRMNVSLSFDDISHYQLVIGTLYQTLRLYEKIEEAYGGFDAS